MAMRVETRQKISSVNIGGGGRDLLSPACRDSKERKEKKGAGTKPQRVEARGVLIPHIYACTCDASLSCAYPVGVGMVPGRGLRCKESTA